MNSFEVAQDVQMKGTGFDTLRASLTEAAQVALRGRKLGVAKRGLLLNQSAGAISTPAAAGRSTSAQQTAEGKRIVGGIN